MNVFEVNRSNCIRESVNKGSEYQTSSIEFENNSEIASCLQESLTVGKCVDKELREGEEVL